MVHLAALHQYGSTNPLGIQAQTDLVDFYPYFYSKDFGAAMVLRAGATF
jgi:ubiquinol-cytochrome c reductase cytochrome b subunit